MSGDTAKPAHGPTPIPASTPRPVRRPRLTRARTVLLTVLLAGAVFLTTTQTWVHATLTSGTVRSIDAAVTGSDAARGVTALALVALAGAVAVSIAGRVARLIIGVLIVLAGAGATASALGVLADPAAAADGKIAAQSGVSGGDIAATPTGWIAVAAAAAVLLALCGVLVLVVGRRWDATRRFEANPAGAGSEPMAESTTEPTAAESAEPVDETPGEPVDDIDSWDRLTRGQDPTA